MPPDAGDGGGHGDGGDAGDEGDPLEPRRVRYRLATWQEKGHSLDVYCQAPGLLPHQLERLPEWTRQTHERLLGTHVQQIGERDETAPKVAAITARLDRLQRPRAVEQTPPTAPARAVGR